MPVDWPGCRACGTSRRFGIAHGRLSTRKRSLLTKGRTFTIRVLRAYTKVSQVTDHALARRDDLQRRVSKCFWHRTGLRELLHDGKHWCRRAPWASALPRGNFLVITYRTDLEALPAVMPEPLQGREPLVKFEFIRMPGCTEIGRPRPARLSLCRCFDIGVAACETQSRRQPPQPYLALVVWITESGVAIFSACATCWRAWAVWSLAVLACCSAALASPAPCDFAAARWLVAACCRCSPACWWCCCNVAWLTDSVGLDVFKVIAYFLG